MTRTQGGPDSAASGSLLERMPPEHLARTALSPGLSDAAKEQYRSIATSLHHAQASRGTKRVLIASSVPSEGKTLTSVNIALTLAESFGRRVLLVDADLRRPWVHRLFGVHNEAGLSEELAETGGGRVIAVTDGLHLLPAGAPTNDPMGPLSSPRLATLMEQAKEAYDWTVVDSPPIGLISDASLLTAHVDGVLFVIAAGQTPVDLVERAVGALGRERILGVVLNKADERAVMGGSGYYYNYYQYYRRYYGPRHHA